MPGVRITSLRPCRKDRLLGRSFAVLSNVRLLWAFLGGGREARAEKRRSQSKFCGAAWQNFGNPEGGDTRCRVFESSLPTFIQERPPFGAVFTDDNNVRLLWGFLGAAGGESEEKACSSRNSAAQHSRISGTARGGDAEDAGCSNHLTPTKSKDRLSGRSFAILSKQ